MRTLIPKLLVASVLGLSLTSVFADDVLPPAYRGQFNTSLQLWNFSTSSTTPAADTANNPFGTPTLTINPSANQTGIGWQDSLPPVYGARQGFWDLGNDGSMGLIIPSSGSGASENIRLQVTYFVSIDQAPVISVSPSATVLMTQNIFDSSTPNNLGSWYTEVLDLSLTPNPANDLITISGNATSGSVIDQVIVDAMVVPEPSTLSIAAVAIVGAGVRFLRRRKG